MSGPIVSASTPRPMSSVVQRTPWRALSSAMSQASFMSSNSRLTLLFTAIGSPSWRPWMYWWRFA